MKGLRFFGKRSRPSLYICVGVVFLLSVTGCSAPLSTATAKPDSQKTIPAEPVKAAAENDGATIPIEPNGPADTVRAFYRLLREKKFREAIFLTNLKPAIESLNDTELKEFAVDFEAIAGQVPAQLEINGEIITGDTATVTVDLPKNEGEDKVTQPIKLKEQGDVWVIMSADEEASKKIAKEGKNYFYDLRIQTHEDAARDMLDSISKAEMAYALKKSAAFADMSTLVQAGFLPNDIMSSESTGYAYAVNLLTNNRYTATATPASYGKSGKLSFLLYLDDKGRSHVTSKDNGGQPLMNK